MRRCTNNHLTENDNFHKGKAVCKTCYATAYQTQRQAYLKGRYDEGDTKVDICTCGVFYLNEKLSGKGVYLTDACFKCSQETKSIIKQTKLSDAVLRSQNEVMRREIKKLIRENVKLRQQVLEYQKTDSQSQVDTLRAA